MPSTSRHSFHLATQASIATLCLCFLLFLAPVQAHVRMVVPAPYNMDNSRAPLLPDGSNYPCKGPMPSGTQPSAVLKAGELLDMSITGVGGGSCQWSLSYDNGQNFMVVYSQLGGCPGVKDPTGAEPQGWPVMNFSVPIPSTAPASDSAIFAWTWVNLQGNRELYMDCARVQVTGGKGGGFQAPGILIANVGAKGGGCATTYGKNTVYPSPGKVVGYGGAYDGGQGLPNWSDTLAGCKEAPMLAVDGTGKSTTSAPDIEPQSVPAPYTPTASPTGLPPGDAKNIKPTGVFGDVSGAPSGTGSASTTKSIKNKGKTDATPSETASDTAPEPTDTGTLALDQSSSWSKPSFLYKCKPRSGDNSQLVLSRRSRLLRLVKRLLVGQQQQQQRRPKR